MLSRLRAFLVDGPVILTLGVATGLAWPALADAARPLLAPCVFIFVAGTFLRLDGKAVITALRDPRYALLLPALAIVALPLLAGLAAPRLGMGAALAAALVLGLAAPPSSANAAIARMLGSDGSTAFVVTTVSTLAVPASVPLVLALAGTGAGTLSPLALALRLGLLLGSAGLLAVLVHRFWPRGIAAYGRAFDAVVVAALFVFALATMSGVPRLFAADPFGVAGVVALAYGTNVALLALFALAMPGPAPERIAVGITMGNRNVGLIWAALGPAIDPLVALYFAAAQLPIFTTPLLIRALRAAR